ncbi:uncharacterized protein LOC135473580 [Liolophura sinensis]|uniref:uncharacterized protein LOC135473580 n=1 Tax=Liolophura sinensis TaxID=3198878 RepID=UPI003158601D
MARTKKKLQDEQRMELERFLAAQRRGGRGRGRGRPRGSGRGGGSQSHTYPAAIFRQPDTFPVIQPSPMAATQTNPELVSATSLPSATPVPSPCSPAMVNVCSSEQVSPRKIIPTVPKGSVMEGLALSSTKMPLKMKPTARKSTVPKRLLTSAAIHSANDSTGVSHTFPSTSGNDNCADMGNIFDIMMSSESPSKTGTGCRNLPEADLGQTVTVFNSVSQAVQNLRRGVKTPIVCMQDIFKYEKRGVKGAKISNPTMQCSQQSTSFTNYNTQKEGFGASESSKGKVGDSPGSKFCVKSQLPKANTDRQTSRVSDNPSTSGMSLGTECTRHSPVVSPNDKLTVPASPGRSPEKRKRSPNVRLGSDMFLFPWHRSRRPREKSSENKGDKKSGKNSVSSGVKILTNSISPGVKKLANSAPPGVKILTNSVSPGVKVLNKDSCNVKDSTTKCSLAQASSTSKSPLIEDSLPVPICTVSTCNAAKVKTGETLTECATEIGACVMELSSSEKVDIEMRTESQQSHTIKSDHSPIPDLKWNDKVNIESKVSCSTQTEQCVSQLKVKYECLPSTSAASDSEMIVGYCDDSIQNNTGELTDTSKIAGDSAAAHKKTDSRLLSLIDRMTARVGNPMKWQDLPSSSPNNEAICDEYDLHLSACSSPCEPPEEESFLEESPLDDTFMDKSPLEESSLKETSMDKSPLEESSSMEVSMDSSPLEELSLKESSMDKSSLNESSLKETSMHKSFLEELSLKEASMYKSSLEELSLKETSVDKSSLKQSSLKETFMDKSSLKESSLKETSMNKSPLEESSLKETSVDKSFLEESSLKEASMDKSSLEELSLKETSMDKSSLKEMSLKETSTDKSPLEESSMKETPTDKSFLEESSLKETSMDKTSLKELSSKETSTDKSPLDESSVKETSMDTSFLEESSLMEACMDKTSLKESSSKETSTDKSPLEESSLKETSMDTSFLEESSLKEACMDKSSLKESSFKEASFDHSSEEGLSLTEISGHESSLEESNFMETSKDKSSLGESSLKESSLGKSSLEVSSTDESCVKDSHVKSGHKPSTSSRDWGKIQSTELGEEA